MRFPQQELAKNPTMLGAAQKAWLLEQVQTIQGDFQGSGLAGAMGFLH